MEIVCSAPSQLVVPIVELGSNDEMEKPHESDDNDEEESGPFVQTETKPLKLPSGIVIKVEKDHRRLEEEKRARRIARRVAREAKKKEMTDDVAASQAEVAEMRRMQAETNKKQESFGTTDGGVDGKDESAGHQFQEISVCYTHNRHISL